MLVETVLKEHFTALCLKFWIPLILEGPWENSSAEDAAEVLRGDRDLFRWAAVTRHDDVFYIRTFTTWDDAVAHSVEYVGDDIFSETPVAICDLESMEEPWGKLHMLTSLTPVFHD